MLEYKNFADLDIRLGTVVKAQEFPEARKAAYKVWVDFGPELGVKQTSAQVTDLYTPESLAGRRVIGVVNIGARKIAGFLSEFLMVGFSNEEGAIRLATVDQEVPNGAKLH